MEYILEFVSDPKKGELHLLQHEPVPEGSTSNNRKYQERDFSR
jgi:hypothetical protein